ncbi:MAG: hypothetical protein WBO00_06045 [Steroidobacteraceae bacterium]
MSIKLMLITSLVLALVGCGSGSEGSDASAAEDAAAAAAEQAGVPSAAGDVLVISKRTYTTGIVKTKVTGFFEVDGSQDLNKPASITDDGSTWIQYGVSGAQDLNVLFTNAEDMAENGVNIGVGPYTVTATSTSGECRTKFDVQPVTITGHYSCTGSTGYNNKTGEMGKVDIEVDFSAGS